jgi:thiol-disulfide isomerase/thioredoxin
LLVGIGWAAWPAAAWPDGEAAPGPVLVLYWGVGCPHCEEAAPFVAALEAEVPGLRVERVEVRRDPEGRRRLLAEAARLGIGAPGIPLFVVGDRWVVGFTQGETEETVRALLGARARPASEPPASEPPASAEAAHVPLLGRVDPLGVPLLALTAVVGLADGFNPCAFWVLLVLLGLLGRVRSRRRVLLLGGAFVLVSGIVYFGFMTAWSGLFALAGGAAWVSAVLGAALLVMGLVNLKDAVWLKVGPSLVIPDAAKPALYARMRAVAGAAGWPAALGGVLVLAALANLVELGCTVGLPAMYTRVLALRVELAPWQRTGWVALYNVFYVVPLGLVVVAWALTLHRFVLAERGARILKGVSGALLVVSGVALLATAAR